MIIKKTLLCSLIICTVIYGANDWDCPSFEELLDSQQLMSFSLTPLSTSNDKDCSNLLENLDNEDFANLLEDLDDIALPAIDSATHSTLTTQLHESEWNSESDCDDEESSQKTQYVTIERLPGKYLKVPVSDQTKTLLKTYSDSDDEYEPSTTDSETGSDEEYSLGDTETYIPVKRKRPGLNKPYTLKQKTDIVDTENPEDLDAWYLEFVKKYPKEPSTKETAEALGIKNYSLLPKREKNTFASKLQRSKLRLFDTGFWPFELDFAELTPFQQKVLDTAKILKEKGTDANDAKAAIKKHLEFNVKKDSRKKNNAEASKFSRAFKKLERMGCWPWTE